MPTCPNGHQSGSEDWCEVCGHRMAGPGAPAGAVPSPPPPSATHGHGYPQPSSGPGAPAAQVGVCPQCRTPREATAPFCEECRYNFVTGRATSYVPVAPQPGSGGQEPGVNLPPGFMAQQGAPQQRDPFEYQSSRPSQVNRPAEPLTPEQGGPPPPPAFQQGPPPPPAFQQQSPSPFERQGQPGHPGQQGEAGRPGPPSPFEPQGQGPQSPPSFQQRSAAPRTEAPQAPAAPRPGGDDDWMLPPPSRQQAFQQSPQAAQAGPAGPAASQVPQQFPGQGAPGQQAPGRGTDNWTAVIAPDRDYFQAMMRRSGPEAAGLNLPAYSPEQRLALTGTQVTVGRRRHSTGESPDIDLAVPPEDPGVSHQHAVLVQQPDGNWAVVDQNSTNGTTLNGAEEPIQPYVPVPLQDGDQVHVGAWTTITVRRD
ncbi:FHA domain-containing protein [Streptomyces sp. NBC_01754]|uniref:FHA domain-containing protein n=1 Tax=Streptomyces sp. NBC_01754 TaxID=2975930 RepID=UPI002DD99FCF|nr:FHA domain-containing protein [Streptomyces sp. NBC_01754]WSC92488.1 FHA domain-containing protein [Streptomyces sp. NBC_01754]